MRAADHPFYFRIFHHKQSMNLAGTPDDLGKFPRQNIAIERSRNSSVSLACFHVATRTCATFVPENGLYYTVPQWWPYDTYLS